MLLDVQPGPLRAMTQPSIDVHRLLSGPHALRRRGVTAITETIRTVEGEHRRSGGPTESSTEFRYVLLGAIGLGVRRHQALHTVALTRHPTSPYIVQFIFDDEVKVSIDQTQFRVEPGQAFLLPPGCRFERQEFDDRGASVSVMFDGAAVRGRLADRLGRELDQPLVFKPEVVAGRNPLLAMLVSIDRALESGLAAPGDAAIDAMQRAFLDLLLDLQPHSYSRALSSGEHGRKSLRIEIVRAIVARDPSAKHSVKDLADAAECSVRSLQATFAEQCATSPIEYVRRLRLELARNRLLDQTCDDPIASIATDFGFASASRFAVEYRRRYGETPSQTRTERSRGEKMSD